MTFLRPPHLKSALVMAVLVAVAACSDSTEPFPDEATFTGRWAGRPWAGEAYVVLVDGGDKGDTLFIGGSRPVNAGSMPLEWVSIRVLFQGPGTYALGAGNADRAALHELTGGDVVSATYTTTALLSGTLVITTYTGPGGEIAGRVSFTGHSDSPYRSYGPIAAFEDGRFRATVTTYP